MNRSESRSLYIARLGDRSLFSDLEPRVYLNHAGISPPSHAVRSAMVRVGDTYARSGAGAFPTWMAQRLRLKTKLADLLHAQPEDIALVQSTTQGVVDIALCFPWERGDRVIVFDGEFPANVTPWQRAAELYGLELVFLRSADFVEDFELGMTRLVAALERGARLVAVSAVQFQTGYRMPLHELAEACHARGAELFVDAVQACGVVPIDVGADRIDYLACGGHKWMMAVEGTGFLYVRPSRVKALRPVIAGWLSHERAIDFLFEGEGRLRYDKPIRASADFFEIGNLSTVGFAAMEAALDLIAQIGVPEILEHVNRYNDPLEAGLLARGFTVLRSPDVSRRSGILSARPAAGVDTIELYREIATRGIACATPDGLLRFSPHWPNHPSEVPEVLAVLDQALAALAVRPAPATAAR